MRLPWSIISHTCRLIILFVDAQCICCFVVTSLKIFPIYFKKLFKKFFSLVTFYVFMFEENQRIALDFLKKLHVDKFRTKCFVMFMNIKKAIVVKSRFGNVST